jgi:FkbM family methyltransferase
MIELFQRSTRALFRRSIISSQTFRGLAIRLPFSRFARLIGPLFGGSALANWRGAHLLVDPGEFEGYYRYFLPEGADDEYDFLVDVCRGASTFFDVGANQGLYSFALAAAYPQMKIVAFEPDPRMRQSIAVNCELNPSLRPRITVEPAAVVEYSGTISFAPAAGTNSGTGYVSGSRSMHTIDVPAVALSDYVRQSGNVPDVLKVDVEGGEVGVLKGLQTYADALRAIVVELHPCLFDGDARSRYQHELVETLNGVPFSWRFLLEEREWRDGLDPNIEWPSRVHAFGRRVSQTNN